MLCSLATLNVRFPPIADTEFSRDSSSMRSILSIAALAVSACSSATQEQQQQRPFDVRHQDSRCAQAVEGFHPSGGVISSELVAKKVALQYLSPMFDGDELRLAAKLQNGIWIVTRAGDASRLGGTADIRMCQSNGRVLAVYLGK